jgi:hypothetical protein
MIVSSWEILMRTLSACIALLILALSGCEEGPSRDRGDNKGTPGGSGAKVSFVKAEIGPVEFEPGWEPKKPLPKYLKVWLKIDTSKKTHIRGWSLGPQSEASLTDDKGKSYALIDEGEWKDKGGNLIMNPGESLTDLLLFEPPDPKATSLTLRLNGRGVDAQRNEPLGRDKDIVLPISGWK